MVWAGTTINWFGIPVNGRRVGMISNPDESFWWGHNEDDNEDYND